MSIRVKNILTGEVTTVNNVRNMSGKLVAEKANPDPRPRFYGIYPFMVKTNETITFEGIVKPCRVFTLAEGFELVAGRTRTPKTKNNSTSDTTVPTTEPAGDSTSEPANEPTTGDADVPTDNTTGNNTSVPTTEPANVPTGNNTDDTDEAAALAELFRRIKGSHVDVETIRNIVREEVATCKPTEVVYKVQVADAPEVTLPSEPHPLFKKVLAMVVNDRVIGRFPWLFGPAGSGKSTIAKQVADALNLPFYSVSSLQQKYELEGYTDATGKLVETTFYKAAKEGGIFLFDEASTTSGEVQVAFNNMLANLVYNFPKEGMVTAHKDFHIIAADNTTGRGGNKTYSARFAIDASTLDRYIPLQVEYTDEQDLRMAAGDAELVTFLRDVRRVIENAGLTYTASPRAAKAIKAMQAMTDVFTEQEALNLGLSSGWKAQDIRTINAQLDGTTKYHKLFNKIANSVK